MRKKILLKTARPLLRPGRKPTHGLRHLDIYQVWANMHARCYRPNCLAYKNYGGRGVFVEQSWHDIKNFVNDMHPRPNGGTLERVDNNGPYSKTNCIWASRKSQARNMRSNRILRVDGVSRTVAEWADIYEIKAKTVYNRLYAGWSDDSAVKTPAGVFNGIKSKNDARFNSPPSNP